MPIDAPTRSSTDKRSGVVALFDFDGTLTHCDSLMPFLRFAVGRARFWGGMIMLIPAMLGYGLGRIDRAVLKEVVLKRFIGNWTTDRLRDVVEIFTTTGLASLCNDEALTRINWHHDQGHRIIIVSASPDAYLGPWAKIFPIEAVLATRIEIRNGIVSGRLDGKNCRGPEKIARLTDYLGALDGYELYAYGDSSGDREMLAIATHAYYQPFRRRGAAITSKLRFLKAML